MYFPFHILNYTCKDFCMLGEVVTFLLPFFILNSASAGKLTPQALLQFSLCFAKKFLWWVTILKVELGILRSVPLRGRG